MAIAWRRSIKLVRSRHGSRRVPEWLGGKLGVAGLRGVSDGWCCRESLVVQVWSSPSTVGGPEPGGASQRAVSVLVRPDVRTMPWRT